MVFSNENCTRTVRGLYEDCTRTVRGLYGNEANGYGGMAFAHREHQTESSISIVSDSDRSEIHFRFVGGVFRGVGPILEPSWAYLEPLVGHLRPSWGHVGPMLGHLRLIWKASGTIRCHLRATLQRAGNESAVQGMYSVFLQVGEASHNFFRQP